jgi:predicted transcriptional regulator
MVAITFKVSPEEARRLRSAARRTGHTLSAHIRAAVLPPTSQRRPRMVIKKHPVSGLPYNAAGKGLPTVTLEQIKDALADFP